MSKILDKIIRLQLPAAAVCILWFCGCKPVGPDYEKPHIDVGESWSAPLSAGLSSAAADPNSLVRWWESLNDDKLTALIHRGLSGNHDLKSALWAVRASRAMRGIEQADRFPTLDADGSAIWTRNDRHTQDSYAAGFDAAWELDIFGGIKRSIEAADADVEASVQQYGDVLISMISEIAVNYVELRTYQAQIAAVNESINTQQQTYQLTLWQYQAGLEDELATQQAKYNLESARSQLPSLNSGFNAALNRLSVLTACKPDEIRRELTELCPVPSLPSQVLVGVPADALRRRPDVRKAEKELIAQTARVGVAAAELYPKLSLGGSIGINGGSLSGLSSNLSAPADWTLQAGPRASWRIFDAGAIRQNIKVQSAKQQQALENYEAAILAAVEEVENALTAYIDEQSRFVNLQNAKQAAKEASLLASRQYEAQLIDFSEVLESQRTLLSFDNQLAQSNGTKTTNLIRLYKALGGGWQLDEAWAN